MRRSSLHLVILGGLVLSSHAARAATTVPGGSLAADLTWTAANSPYLVQGDFTVPAGNTLTLEAGTEIQFASGDDQASGADMNRAELIIDGTLQASGTAAAPILLHAQGSAGPLAWYGVVIDASASARLTHIDIEDANNAVTAGGTSLSASYSTFAHNVAGISLSAGNAMLDAVELSNNSSYGLFVLANASPATFTLTNGVLRLNGSYGVYASSALGQVVTGSIINCTVYGNISSGIEGQAAGADAKVTLAVENSIVSNNGISGIYADPIMDGVVTITTTYSDVWSNGTDFDGAEAGENCLSADPQYVLAPGDLTLPSSSVCNGAGSATHMPPLDFLATARSMTRADLGAYAQPVVTKTVTDPAIGGCQFGGRQRGSWGWAAFGVCALVLVGRLRRILAPPKRHSELPYVAKVEGLRKALGGGSRRPLPATRSRPVARAQHSRNQLRLA